MGDQRFQTTIQALLAAGLQLQQASGTGVTVATNASEAEHRHNESVYMDGEHASFSGVDVGGAGPDAGIGATGHTNQQVSVRHLSENISSVDGPRLATGSSSANHDGAGAGGDSHPAYRVHIVPHNFYGPCKVCNADATGLHYGVATCEGCKGFFKRSLETDRVHPCASGTDNCEITSRTRNACRSCRLKKCREVGMEWKLHRKRFRMRNLIHQRASATDLPTFPASFQQNRSIPMAKNTFAVPTSCTKSPRLSNTLNAVSIAPTHARTIYADEADAACKSVRSANYNQQQLQQQSNDSAIINDALRNGNSNLNAVLSQETINKLLKIIANSTGPQQQQQQANVMASQLTPPLPSPHIHSDAGQSTSTNSQDMLSNAAVEQRQQLLQLVGRLSNSFSNSPSVTIHPQQEPQAVAEQTLFVQQHPNTEMRQRISNPVEIARSQEQIEVGLAVDEHGALNFSTKTPRSSFSRPSSSSLPTTTSSPSVHQLSVSPAVLSSSSQRRGDEDDAQSSSSNTIRDYRLNKQVSFLISEARKNIDDGVISVDDAAQPEAEHVPLVKRSPERNTFRNTFSTLQSQAVTRELNASVARLLTKRKSLPTVTVNVVPVEDLDCDTKSSPRRSSFCQHDKNVPSLDEILAAVRHAKPFPTVGNVCDYWCEKIWPTCATPAAAAAEPVEKLMMSVSYDAASSVKRAKLSPESSSSSSQANVSLKHRILSDVAESQRRSASRSPPLPVLPTETDILYSVDDFLNTPPSSAGPASEFSFTTDALACAASPLGVKLRMRELADYAQRQTSLSLALHVRNFLRPNIGILNACARQFDDGFTECWLLRFERGKRKCLRKSANVTYQPETTIERFYVYLNAFVLALLRVQCKFAEQYIPGFWSLSPAVRAFCVTTNYSAMYLAVFGPVVKYEGRGMCINLGDMKFNSAMGSRKHENLVADGSTTPLSVDGAVEADENSNAQEMIASDYWLSYHMPEPVLVFFRTAADFIREIELPNILRAAFAATVFLRPLRMDRIPEHVREEVAARLFRSSQSRSQWRRYETELAETHEYTYRLLHQLIVQHYGTQKSGEDYEQQQRTARIVYNKILFFLTVVSERLAVFDCKIFESTPLHFYDDGSFDYERLRYHVDSCCSPKLARWLNAVWPVAKRTDFARQNFSINEILVEVDNAATRHATGDDDC